MRGRVAEPQNARSTRKPFYRPELDLLRFFAFSCVFLGHSEIREYLPRNTWKIQHAGNFGVCLFFFLSSYLITELLIREREKTDTVRLRDFYIRRTLRIWPLYFGFLGFCWLLSDFQPHMHISRGRLLAFVLFVGNWYSSVHSWTFNPISPLWSISNEEQFYLIMPLVAKFGGRRAIAISSGIFLAVSYVTLFVLAKQGSNVDYTIWANSLVQFQFFAAGGLIALILRGSAPKLNQLRRVVMVGVGLLLWFVASGVFKIKLVRYGFYQQPWQICAGYAAVLAGTILIFFAFLGAGDKWTPQWAVYLGKVSYGLYVFHVLALDLFVEYWPFRAYFQNDSNFAVGAALTIVAPFLLTVALAALSYEYFEKPFLRLKQRFTVVKSRPA